MKIMLADYWMGRDREYPMAMSPALEVEALRTVALANQLLDRLDLSRVQLIRNDRTGSIVSSGWRPPTVNASTPGAAPNSRHITGQAIDLFDPEGDIDGWLMAPPGQQALQQIGLWMEHPASTKGWSHVQTIAPRSGNRVFYP